jgi:hypothetical protein
MLSRAQEARVREILGRQPPGAAQTFCPEHLAVAVAAQAEMHSRS